VDHRGRWALHVHRVDSTEQQYVREERAFEAVSGRAATMNIRMNRVVVFVDTYDLVTERSLLYCLSLNAYSIRAVHFDIDRSSLHTSKRSGARPEPRRPASRSRSSSVTTAVSTGPRWNSSAAIVARRRRSLLAPWSFCRDPGYVSRLRRFLHDRSADAIAGRHQARGRAPPRHRALIGASAGSPRRPMQEHRCSRRVVPGGIATANIWVADGSCPSVDEVPNGGPEFGPRRRGRHTRRSRA